MVRQNWVNLNGRWDYRIEPTSTTTPTKFDGKIVVPFPVESLLSEVQKPLLPGNTLWYRRTFRLPPSWNERVLLHFGAVDYQARVWVNGELVGEHKGGFSPFSFEISRHLKTGEQEVVVAVEDPTDTAGIPRGKQVFKPEGIWYTPSSGIWQTVWAEAIPQSAIESYTVVPNLAKRSVSMTVSSSDETAQVSVEVKFKGKVVATARKAVNRPFEVPIPEPALWSPESPNLYDLKITLVEGGKPGDVVTGYFGMREMHLGKDKAGVTRLFLNGKPYFQYGPLDQGFWPDGLYSPPTDAALKFDIEAAKKMGCNMLRKHVKVESERFYHHCDKVGILVWQDMPSGDFPKDKGAAYEHEWPKIIKARYNHPSIVMWIPFNEGWGQYDTERIVDMTRRLDPHRLVNNASGWTDKGVGDVLDIHAYPGPSTPQWEPKRAAVLGEFGGLGLPVEGHTWVEKNNWGYVSYKTKEELTAAYLELLRKTKELIPMGLSAAVYTQTTDVEVEVNGWLTYDRKVWKIEPGKVLGATKALYAPPASFVSVVPVQRSWRYTLTDPGADWIKEAFDDTSWKAGNASFGTEITPGAKVGTEWKTEAIWIRRKFNLSAADLKPSLRLWIHHDEDAKVYLNGVLAADLKGYVGNYVTAPIDPKALKALRAGENTIAIHCRQTRGGQNIDCGFIRLEP